MEMRSSSLCLDALLITRPPSSSNQRGARLRTPVYASDPSNKESALRRLPQPKAVSTVRRAFLGGLETVFPGGTVKWNARRKLAARARSQSGRVLFLLESGAIHLIRRLREGAAGQRLLRGEHCSVDYQGFMKGGAAEGARGEGDFGPASREEGIGAPARFDQMPFTAAPSS
jgi:hypothetical protein